MHNIMISCEKSLMISGLIRQENLEHNMTFKFPFDIYEVRGEYIAG